MSQRSEHGGGEKAMREIAEACEQEEIETANRRIAAFHKSEQYLAYLALHEIDRIIQEENERCPIQESTVEEDRDKLLPPLYD